MVVRGSALAKYLCIVVTVPETPENPVPETQRRPGWASGIAGAWAGCVTGASFESPSLVVPFCGEVTTDGAACLVGGFFGGLGFGYVGAKLVAVGEAEASNAGVLVIGWYPSVSVFRGFILGQIYGHRKP